MSLILVISGTEFASENLVTGQSALECLVVNEMHAMTKELETLSHFVAGQ